MKIVIETTFVTSLFLNCLVLALTSTLTRKRAKIWFFSANIGSLISLFYPFFIFSAISKIILLALCQSIAILISFHFDSLKDFFLIFGMMSFSTFLFGGAMLATENIFGNFSLMIVSIVGLAIFLISKTIAKIQHKKNIIKNFTYLVKIKDNGQEIEEEGFLDSGNMLYDNITKKPIILITYKVFQKLYKQIPMTKLLTKSIDESSIKNGHYIKINSLASKTSLLIFSIDELEINNESHKNVMVGLSFSGFEKTFGKNVLLHSELI